MAEWARWDGDDLILQVRVQPRARRDEIAGLHGGRLRVRITAPPTDGRANEQLIRFLADRFQVPRARVELLSGSATRDKRLRIAAPARLPEGLDIP